MALKRICDICKKKEVRRPSGPDFVADRVSYYLTVVRVEVKNGVRRKQADICDGCLRRKCREYIKNKK